jgi:hypothetical protein
MKTFVYVLCIVMIFVEVFHYKPLNISDLQSIKLLKDTKMLLLDVLCSYFDIFVPKTDIPHFRHHALLMILSTVLNQEVSGNKFTHKV